MAKIGYFYRKEKKITCIIFINWQQFFLFTSCALVLTEFRRCYCMLLLTFVFIVLSLRNRASFIYICIFVYVYSKKKRSWNKFDRNRLQTKWWNFIYPKKREKKLNIWIVIKHSIKIKWLDFFFFAKRSRMQLSRIFCILLSFMITIAC